MKHPKLQFEHIIGMNSAVASIQLESEGYKMRVCKLNGQWQELKANVDYKRINVIVEAGIIIGIDGIY